MSQFVGQRFGQDSYARIATSAEMLLEATEVLPYEPMYQPLVPFYPPSISTGGGDGTSSGVLPGETTADGHKIWKRLPARCDLTFYQGDDIVVPLYFNDPSIADDNMALDTNWFAQIRRIHSYRSTLINEFITADVFHTGTDETDEYTKVELYLPRQDNIYSGYYRWDLYSIGPADLARFPKPADVAPEDWPPLDALRTWLYGKCTIIPRVTTTDALPPGTVAIGSVGVVAIDTGMMVVGPNGRVP